MVKACAGNEIVVPRDASLTTAKPYMCLIDASFDIRPAGALMPIADDVRESAHCRKSGHQDTIIRGILIFPTCDFRCLERQNGVAPIMALVPSSTRPPECGAAAFYDTRTLPSGSPSLRSRAG